MQSPVPLKLARKIRPIVGIKSKDFISNLLTRQNYSNIKNRFKYQLLETNAINLQIIKNISAQIVAFRVDDAPDRYLHAQLGSQVLIIPIYLIE